MIVNNSFQTVHCNVILNHMRSSFSLCSCGSFCSWLRRRTASSFRLCSGCRSRWEWAKNSPESPLSPWATQVPTLPGDSPPSDRWTPKPVGLSSTRYSGDFDPNFAHSYGMPQWGIFRDIVAACCDLPLDSVGSRSAAFSAGQFVLRSFLFPLVPLSFLVIYCSFYFARSVLHLRSYTSFFVSEFISRGVHCTGVQALYIYQYDFPLSWRLR